MKLEEVIVFLLVNAGCGMRDAASGRVTLKILDHPYIWGGVQFCINVSEKPYTSELEAT